MYFLCFISSFSLELQYITGEKIARCLSISSTFFSRILERLHVQPICNWQLPWNFCKKNKNEKNVMLSSFLPQTQSSGKTGRQVSQTKLHMQGNFGARLWLRNGPTNQVSSVVRISKMLKHLIQEDYAPFSSWVALLFLMPFMWCDERDLMTTCTHLPGWDRMDTPRDTSGVTLLASPCQFWVSWFGFPAMLFLQELFKFFFWGVFSL